MALHGIHSSLPSHLQVLSCGSETGIYNSTVDFGPRTKEGACTVAYLSCMPATLYEHYHAQVPLKSDTNVRIAGSDRIYFYLSNWDKNVSEGYGLFSPLL
jgi:hypothetical protein